MNPDKIDMKEEKKSNGNMEEDVKSFFDVLFNEIPLKFEETEAKKAIEGGEDINEKKPQETEVNINNETVNAFAEKNIEEKKDVSNPSRPFNNFWRSDSLHMRRGNKKYIV